LGVEVDVVHHVPDEEQSTAARKVERLRVERLGHARMIEPVTLSEHIVEIISDSGEGAQKCGQSLGAIAAQMGNGIWTTEIIPAEIRPPARSGAGARGNRLRHGPGDPPTGGHLPEGETGRRRVLDQAGIGPDRRRRHRQGQHLAVAVEDRAPLGRDRH